MMPVSTFVMDGRTLHGHNCQAFLVSPEHFPSTSFPLKDTLLTS
jgi:hypothetical protein